jgi:hypothetical protein
MKQYVLNIMRVLLYFAFFLRCIIVSSVACLAVPYFSTLSPKRYVVRKCY